VRHATEVAAQRTYALGDGIDRWITGPLTDDWIHDVVHPLAHAATQEVDVLMSLGAK
jgi:hypothetical protein